MQLLSLLLLTLVTNLKKVSAGTRCAKIFPGANYVLKGIDLTTFSMKAKSRKQLVFDFTCTEGIKLQFEGEEWDQPDQIKTVDIIHQESRNDASETIKTTSDVTKELQKGASVSGGYGPVTGMLSAEAKEMRNTVQNGTKIINRMERKKVTMEVQIGSRSTLDEDTLWFIEDLPDSYIDDPEPYTSFIGEFGTHYISSVRLGGIARQEYVTSTKYMKDHNIDEMALKADINLAFTASVGASGNYNRTEKKKIDELKKNTEIKMSYIGGKADLMKDGWIKTWQPTVALHPGIVTTSFRPIYNIIRTDKNKRKQMQMAVDKYLQDAYYRETTKLINKLIYNGRKSTTLNNLVNSMEKMRKLPAGSKGRRKPVDIQEELDDYYMRHSADLKKDLIINLHTCDKFNAGTDATIRVNIKGSKGETGHFILPNGSKVKQMSGCPSDPFERNCNDIFKVTPTNNNIGKILEVELYNNGEGRGSDWDLCQMIITHGDEKVTKSFRNGSGTEIEDQNNEIVTFRRK